MNSFHDALKFHELLCTQHWSKLTTLDLLEACQKLSKFIPFLFQLGKLTFFQDLDSFSIILYRWRQSSFASNRPHAFSPNRITFFRFHLAMPFSFEFCQCILCKILKRCLTFYQFRNQTEFKTRIKIQTIIIIFIISSKKS